MVSPHGVRVYRLLAKARSLGSGRDSGLIREDRAIYQQIYLLMKRASELAPQDLEVLALLGEAADELGKTAEATAAFESAIQIGGVDKVDADVVARLGGIYLRAGDRDTALRWLRQVPGPTSAPRNNALVHLASALSSRGELTAAIDTIKSVVPTTPSFGARDTSLLSFTLAVLYDRDDQPSAAFEVIDRMQRDLQTGYAENLRTELARFRFAPVEDEHYYRALFYESLGHYPEARVEWMHYANCKGGWRTRALDHVAAIDRGKRAAEPAAQPPPVFRPRRRP